MTRSDVKQVCRKSSFDKKEEDVLCVLFTIISWSEGLRRVCAISGREGSSDRPNEIVHDQGNSRVAIRGCYSVVRSSVWLERNWNCEASPLPIV